LRGSLLIPLAEYAEALMFDQLKAAMSDPDTNPFPGFQEALIDFPPTFKYDVRSDPPSDHRSYPAQVWKSVKATKRDLRRSMRVRRSTYDAKHGIASADIEDPESANTQRGLLHVPQADDCVDETANRATTDANVEDSEWHPSEDDYHTDGASRRCFDSSAFTSVAHSTAGTDVDDLDDSDDGNMAHYVDATVYGSRHKAFEVALKQKTKRFLGLVKMDGIMTPSPSLRQLDRRAAKHRHDHELRHGLDGSSRRTSMSSVGPMHGDAGSQPLGNLAETPTASSSRLPALPDLCANAYSSELPRLTPSIKSPRRPMIRRIFGHKRTVSGLSVQSVDACYGDDAAGLEAQDGSVDNREGVYDTSRKQRVPSWVGEMSMPRRS